MKRQLTIVIDYDDEYVSEQLPSKFEVGTFMIDLEQDYGHLFTNVDYVDEEVKNDQD
jgi:hypothetical protein